MAFKQTQLVVGPAQELIFNFVGDVKTLEVYVTPSLNAKKDDDCTKTLYLSKADVADFADELNKFITGKKNVFNGKTVSLFSDSDQKFVFSSEDNDNLTIELYDEVSDEELLTTLYLTNKSANDFYDELNDWYVKMV